MILIQIIPQRRRHRSLLPRASGLTAVLNAGAAAERVSGDLDRPGFRGGIF
jgi:hypothetical protein